MWHGISVVRGLAILVVGGVAIACIATHQMSAIGGSVAVVVGAVAVFLKGGNDANPPAPPAT